MYPIAAYFSDVSKQTAKASVTKFDVYDIYHSRVIFYDFHIYLSIRNELHAF